jgi:outer membrane beta-barrel protein
MKIILLIAFTLYSLTLSKDAFAQGTPTPSNSGEAADVSKVTEKYWAEGKESELGVVQNRRYSNEGHIELDLLTGSISSDPFLSTSSYGGSIGYHLTPNLSLHAIAWKASADDSDAYRQLRVEAPSADLYRNRPRGFYGLQVNENLLYGKASLFGKMIIYVDLFILGGAGMTSTDTGSNFTPFVGLGQKIHLNSFAVLHLDYRIMRYAESVKNSGGLVRERANVTDAVSLGLGLQF